MNESHKDFEKMLMEFYHKGFADCEAAANKALEHGIKHAILLEREACAALCYAEKKVRLAETILARGKK